MSLFRTKETKVMIIIFGLFIQQLTNPDSDVGLIPNSQSENFPEGYTTIVLQEVSCSSCWYSPRKLEQ